MNRAEARLENEIKMALMPEGLQKRMYQFAARELEILENYVMSEIHAKEHEGKRLYKEDGENLIIQAEAIKAINLIANELNDI